MRGFFVGGSLVALLLGATPVWPAPAEYAIPPPPPNVTALGLPALSTNEAEAAGTDLTSMRGMRDAAQRAFYAGDFTNCIAWIDRMAKLAPPARNFRLLQAWAATYAGQDERAATLWSTLADEQPDQAVPQELAGWHAFRLNLTSNALARYTAAQHLDPAQTRLLVMTALLTWQDGRTATAQRHLVQAMRKSPPPVESFVAMAALLATSGSYPESAGWLRRGLRGLDPAQQAHWLKRSDFLAMSESWPDGWRDLLNDLDQQNLLEDQRAPSVPAPQPPPATFTPPPTGPDQFLRLALFAPEPSIRQEQIRIYQAEQILRRLQANDILTEEQRLGEFEMRLDAR